MEILLDILFAISFLFIVIVGYLTFISEQKHTQLMRKKEIEEIELKIELVKQDILASKERAIKTLDILTNLSNENN